MKLIIHTDGGARGNPGPAAIGVVIEICDCADVFSCSEGQRKEIAGFGKRIGETTNNVAEYTAVIEALRYVKGLQEQAGERSGASIVFYLDSTLVVNQLNGVFRIKDANLRTLATEVRMLENDVDSQVQYRAVRREHNIRADYFVNSALDA